MPPDQDPLEQLKALKQSQGLSRLDASSSSDPLVQLNALKQAKPNNDPRLHQDLSDLRGQIESTSVHLAPKSSASTGSLSDVVAQGLGGGPVSALVDAIANPSSYQGHFWENMKASQAGLNRRSADYSERHPVIGGGASVLSGLVPVMAATAATGGLAAPEALASRLAPGFAARTVGGAAAGGLAQGASTLVNTPGGMSDRIAGLEKAGFPTAGVVTGATLPAASGMLGSFINRIGGNAGATNALGAFAKRLGQAGMFPEDLAIGEANAPKGAPLVAADLMGRPGQKLVRWTTDQPSFGGAELEKQLTERNTGQLDRTLANMKGAMGQDFQNIPATQEQMVADMKARAKPLYDVAKPISLPAHIVSEVQRLRGAFPEIDKAFQSGDVLRKGDTAIEGGNISPAGVIQKISPEIARDPKMLDALRSSGYRIPGDQAPLTVGDVHYAKLGLDDLIDRKSDGSGIAPTRARQLRLALNGLLGQVDQAVPEYQAARNQYRGDAEMNEAMELGKKALHLPVDELAHATKDYSPGEQQAFRASAMNQLKLTAKDVPASRDLMARWINSPNMEDRLKLIAPSDEAAQQLLAHRDVERTMAATGAAPRAGSNTSTNLADQPGHGFLTGATIGRSFLSPRRALMSAAGQLGTMVERKLSTNLSDNLGPLLGTPREEIPALIQRLQATKNKALRQALYEQLAAKGLGVRAGITQASQ